MAGGTETLSEEVPKSNADRLQGIPDSGAGVPIR